MYDCTGTGEGLRGGGFIWYWTGCGDCTGTAGEGQFGVDEITPFFWSCNLLTTDFIPITRVFVLGTCVDTCDLRVAANLLEIQTPSPFGKSFVLISQTKSPSQSQLGALHFLAHRYSAISEFFVGAPTNFN